MCYFCLSLCLSLCVTLFVTLYVTLCVTLCVTLSVTLCVTMCVTLCVTLCVCDPALDCISPFGDYFICFPAPFSSHLLSISLHHTHFAALLSSWRSAKLAE